MELVGRTVKKEFLGLGIINGTVRSYDPVDGYFEIVYQDGDSEEMDFNEVVQILEGDSNVEQIVVENMTKSLDQRRPKKKRRRGDVEAGKFSDFFVKDQVFMEPQMRNSLNCDSNVCFSGFDLNVDISMVEDEDENGCVDVNLEGNESNGERIRKVPHDFDINLGLEEENEDFDGEVGLQVEGGFKKIDLSVESDGGDDGTHGTLKKEKILQNVEGIQLRNNSGLSENGKEDNLLAAVEETYPQLKDCSGVSEHKIEEVGLQRDGSSVVLKETHLEDRIGLSEEVRAGVCLRIGEGIGSHNNAFGGDFREIALKKCSIEFHSASCGSDVIIVENHEDKLWTQTSDKGTVGHKKRGRPKKSTLTTKIDELVRNEGVYLGGGPIHVASRDVIASAHLNAHGSDVVVAPEHNHINNTSSELPDTGAGSRKKRGRPKKKSTLTTQIDERVQSEDVGLGGGHLGVALEDDSGSFHLNTDASAVVLALEHNPVNNSCSEPPDKGAGSRKKRGRPRKSTSTTPIDELVQTEDVDLGGVASVDISSSFHSNADGSGAVVALERNYVDNTCPVPADHGTGSRKKRGRPKKSTSTTQVDALVFSKDMYLDGGYRGVASKEISASFDLMADGSGVVIALAHNREDSTCLRPPDKGAGSCKKRGRPKKSTPTTQLDENIQNEGTHLGEHCKRVDSDNTMKAGVAGEVITVNCENGTCSEPPDMEACTRRKLGRYKKLKSTTQTMLSPMEIGTDVNSTLNHGEKTFLETPVIEACSSRKRGRTSGGSNSTSQTLLRRSTRRSSSTSLIHASSMDESLASNSVSSPAEIHIVLDSSFEGFRERDALPPKPELPPSSEGLNIDEIPIIDLFSVYSFLRSFSTILFLSPFSLEAFLESLKQRCPNMLIDSIHFSILHTLKLHLEFLSEEGLQSAIVCLRSLNWALLDVVTWPIYMVEYLLIRGSAMKPSFERGHLKAFMDNYYDQSPSLKIEILRWLCDDVIEAECVRSELGRRMQASELDMDVDRIANVEMKRKKEQMDVEMKRKKEQMDDGTGSCLTLDLLDDTVDGNSDECCLCKMDGSLICCDGCPAAYHARCVGIVKDALPEGEWFCPECVINKYDMRMKTPKSLRGAELLGTDPHGRLYFGTCGYLLVLDSCDQESFYNFYNSSDLKLVIDVLKSCGILYGSIVNAISINCGIFGGKDSQNFQSRMEMSDKVLYVNSDTCTSVPLKETSEAKIADKPCETYVRNEDFDLQGFKVSDSVIKHDSGLMSQSINGKNSLAKYEALADILKVTEVHSNCQDADEDGSNGLSKFLGSSKVQRGTHPTVADCALQSSVSCITLEKNAEILPSHASTVTNIEKGALAQVHSEPHRYVNCYFFGQIAASIAQELIPKSPDNVKVNFKRSLEEFISAQHRVISKQSTNFCWSTIQGIHKTAQQEDCGWCFYCQNPTESETCLFKTSSMKPSPNALENGAASSRSKKSWRSHLFDVICYILSIEERLCGLLCGPWKNASFSKTWHKNVLKSSNIASVKQILLTLELNLHRLAFQPDWLKHVDTVATMGSASHVMATPVQVPSSKLVGGKKRAKCTVAEINPASTSAAKLSTFWWRGGRVTRQLFNYKILPRSLASKGARQAGCKKVSGMLYPDGSEFSKRSKCIAWRASVEMSTSVPHLAYLVRELDSNIRWDDLENIQSFSHLSKESKKTMKLFKKVTIRRKRIERTNVMYLLDFGKRRGIPDTVIKNGVMLEVSSSERKKYWLEESLVPLHILKSYEEKKLARTSGKMKPGPVDEVAKFLRKSSRRSGLQHLLSREQKSEYYKCGHCRKDVLIREAVNCQDCEGFFHRRHVKKSESSSAVESRYQCQKCRNNVPVKKSMKITSKIPRTDFVKEIRKIPLKRSLELIRKESQANSLKEIRKIPVKKSVKTKPRGRKLQSRKCKKAPTVERRIPLPRKVKYMPVQGKKVVGAKKRKRVKPRNQPSKKSKKEICWHKGRRTPVYHAYWLNGLRLTRNSNDARLGQFRESKLLVPSQDPSANVMVPKCHLCREASYRSMAIYVNCENCQEWFHGEAFGITVENNSMVLGFTCHMCRLRSPPVCPYLQDAQDNEARLSDGAGLSDGGRD